MTFGMMAILNVPAIFNLQISGSLFWGIGYFLSLNYITHIGRPDPNGCSDEEMLRFDIGID